MKTLKVLALAMVAAFTWSTASAQFWHHKKHHKPPHHKKHSTHKHHKS